MEPDETRLVEDREAKLQALREALIAGETSGPADYSLQGLIGELDGSTTVDLAFQSMDHRSRL